MLDVGGGLGGAAPFLASTVGCRVTVVDLTEAYVTVGRETKVGTEIRFVTRLSELPEVVPREMLPVEDAADEGDTLIEDLRDSGNFARTHSLIAQLNRAPAFTAAQAESLVGALDNSQVGWILGDGQKLTLEDRKALTDLLARYSEPDSWQEEGF